LPAVTRIYGRKRAEFTVVFNPCDACNGRFCAGCGRRGRIGEPPLGDHQSPQPLPMLVCGTRDVDDRKRVVMVVLRRVGRRVRRGSPGLALGRRVRRGPAGVRTAAVPACLVGARNASTSVGRPRPTRSSYPCERWPFGVCTVAQWRIGSSCVTTLCNLIVITTSTTAFRSDGTCYHIGVSDDTAPLTKRRCAHEAIMPGSESHDEGLLTSITDHAEVPSLRRATRVDATNFL